MQNRFRRVPLYFIMSGLLVSCATYKQNIMMKPGEGFVPDPIKASALQAERNYVIQKNDFLVLDIYSNSGEKLIDPNPELSESKQSPSDNKNEIKYLVDLNGVSKFPMIGEIKVEGLTLRHAELVLQKEFEKYFKSPFVTLRFINKRVVVLGAPGGQVIPLENENITLAEVLALAKGIEINGKAHNIRVVRGEQVFLADLATIDGFQKANMIIEPGDIVYVEPVRKPLIEGFRDYSILVSLVVSITSLIILSTR
jgi:polysaccharide biosynthesis/export protein